MSPECYICLLIGVLIGTLITRFLMSLLTSRGTLRIDRSDPEKDIVRLDIPEIDTIVKKKWISLRIDSHSDLSQK